MGLETDLLVQETQNLVEQLLTGEEREFIKEQIDKISICCTKMVEHLEAKMRTKIQPPTVSIQLLTQFDPTKTKDNMSMHARRSGTEMNVLDFGKTLDGPKAKLLQSTAFQVKHEKHIGNGNKV